MKYAVVETLDQNVQSVNVFPDQAQAVAHATHCARDNDADESDDELASIFQNDGYWDQGDWRISVVSVANNG